MLLFFLRYRHMAANWLRNMGITISYWESEEAIAKWKEHRLQGEADLW